MNIVLFSWGAYGSHNCLTNHWWTFSDNKRWNRFYWSLCTIVLVHRFCANSSTIYEIFQKRTKNLEVLPSQIYWFRPTNAFAWPFSALFCNTHSAPKGRLCKSWYRIAPKLSDNSGYAVPAGKASLHPNRSRWSRLRISAER